MGMPRPRPFALHLRHYRQSTYVLGPVKEDLIVLLPYHRFNETVIFFGFFRVDFVMSLFPRASDLILEYKPKTPSMPRVQMRCANCGVNFVKEEGEWCWVCIRDRESLD